MPSQEISYHLWASRISGRTSKFENVCFVCVCDKMDSDSGRVASEMLYYNVKYCYILLQIFLISAYVIGLLHNMAM